MNRHGLHSRNYGHLRLVINVNVARITEEALPIFRGHIPPGQVLRLQRHCLDCRAWHIHGWPSRSKDPNYHEHRAPHCFDKAGRHRSLFYPAGYIG